MSKKYTFFLKGINIKEVEEKYGLSIVSNIENETVVPSNKTNIFDIMDKVDELPVSFVDDKNEKCLITMFDWIHKEKFPIQTNISCFWCKHSFSNKPLGCPIKYVNHRIEKSYISNITKDKYYMKENVTKQKLENVLQVKNSMEVKPIETEHYVTDGIFCSFNCIIAFVNDHSYDPFYRESKTLTYTMYNEIVGKDVKKIKASPHWRLLKTYGGPLSIDEFRKTLNIFEYEECAFHMKTLSKIFKEK